MPPEASAAHTRLDHAGGPAVSGAPAVHPSGNASTTLPYQYGSTSGDQHLRQLLPRASSSARACPHSAQVTLALPRPC